MHRYLIFGLTFQSILDTAVESMEVSRQEVHVIQIFRTGYWIKFMVCNHYLNGKLTEETSIPLSLAKDILNIQDVSQETPREKIMTEASPVLKPCI